MLHSTTRPLLSILFKSFILVGSRVIIALLGRKKRWCLTTVFNTHTHTSWRLWPESAVYNLTNLELLQQRHDQKPKGGRREESSIDRAYIFGMMTTA